MARLFRWLMVPAVIVALLAAAYGIGFSAEAGPKEALPDLDKDSAKGLILKASVAKQFSVGQPVNVWCTLTNTTDTIKPVAWQPRCGGYFCLTQDAAQANGVLPLVIPQLPEPITIRSQVTPGYILYLPPHASLQLLLTYKAATPEKFAGVVMYDPVEGGADTVAARQERTCVSNPIQFEVVAAKKK